jgi:hypothetical protein
VTWSYWVRKRVIAVSQPSAPPRAIAPMLFPAGSTFSITRDFIAAAYSKRKPSQCRSDLPAFIFTKKP